MNDLNFYVVYFQVKVNKIMLEQRSNDRYSNVIFLDFEQVLIELTLCFIGFEHIVIMSVANKQ